MDIRASVAMAVCNGEKYIRQQIDSILNMMGPNDEIVISYDQSQDNTLEIINEYKKQDNRITVVFDEGKSVESNFNNAVKRCRGKYIFLSDQDDIWINNKINAFIKIFKENPKVKIVIGDGYITDSNLKKIGELFKDCHVTSNRFRNFVKGTYLGCQMAFTNDIKDKVWPVKTTPPLPHDLWLGVMGSLYGKVFLYREKTIMHRIHTDNYSNNSKMNLKNVIQNRIEFASEIIKRYLQNSKHSKNE